MALAALLAGAAVGRAQQADEASNGRQPGNTAAATSSPATPASRGATNAPPGAKSSADAQAAATGLSTEQLKEARDEGYRPVTRGKATLYCRSELLVGTAFPIRTCYNVDRLKVVMEQERAQRMQLKQMHGSGTQGH